MKFSFKRKVLKNGLVVIFEKRNIPVVSVGIGVKQGGINEFEDEKGISHFIEHMLYKGTTSRTNQQIAESIEKNGGDLNGFTSEEITAYWCKMPSKKLNIALEVLTDMVKNSVFDDKELEKERKVIFEEIKMRKDNPHIFVLDEIQSNLYDGTLGLPVIGNDKTMKAINREKILKKFQEVYKPNNLILCVVGDADFNFIIDFAEKNFGDEKGKNFEQKIKLKNQERILKRKGIDQANLIFAYHVPLSRDKKSYAARVLSSLMAGGMSSRLFQEIREKRNLAYGVAGYSEINNFFAYNSIYVGTTPENVKKVKELILEEFKKIAEGLDEKEFSEIKEKLIGNYYISQEDSQGQMINLLVNELGGDAKSFYDFEKNITSVKLEEVKEIARGALKDFSFFALVPDKKNLSGSF